MIRLKISNLRHLAENFLIFILVDNHRSAFGRFTLQRILMEFFFCNFRLKSLEFAGNCLSFHPLKGISMLELHDCINKLVAFKQTFGKQFGITKLGIFGSVARQENTEDSDIDIVVEVEKPTLSLMYELKEALKASTQFL